MTNSYDLKARPTPNLFDLSMMEGVLNGGGSHTPVTREAYWAEPSPQELEILQWMGHPDAPSLDE